jgi:hypothetical protein
MLLLQVMRLHALYICKASAPNSSSSGSSGSSNSNINLAPPRDLLPSLAAQFPILREKVLSLLTVPLAGDRLAAEYLLLTLLGSVSIAFSASVA